MVSAFSLFYSNWAVRLLHSSDIANQQPKLVIKIKHPKGQVIVGVLGIILVSGLLLIMLFNNGLALREKTRLVNAADAVAYSEGIITARRLNFLAYTNRAVVANHLTAGHAVIYMSWLNYATTTWQANPQFYNYVDANGNLRPEPPVRWAMANGLGILAANLNNYQADVSNFLGDITAANAILSAAQVSSVGGALALNTQVRNLTAAQFDNNANNPIRINDAQDVINTINLANNLGDNDLAAALSAINNQDLELINFMNMANNSFNFLEMTTAGIDPNNPNQIPGAAWFNTRDWSANTDGDGRIRAFNSPAAQNWVANDSVTDGINTYTGNASALNINPAYAPFAGNFASLPTINGLPGSIPLNATLTRTVLAAIDLKAQNINPAADPNDFSIEGLRSFNTIDHRGSPANPQPAIILTAHSRAEIYYQRPQANFLDNFAFAVTDPALTEYANLYNPFWQVRLVSVPTNF